MAKIGGHVHSGGLLLEAFKQAQALEFTCFQMFIGPNTSYRPNKYNRESVQQFRELKQRGSYQVAAHSNYYVNLCQLDERDNWSRSIGSVVEQLKLCHDLDIDFLVVHPGSHKGAGMDRGNDLLIQACERIMLGTTGCKTKLLLENTAGGGSTCGGLTNLVGVLDKISDDRIGLCFDTTHAWADGWDMTSKVTCDEVLRMITSTVKWIHFNMPDHNVAKGSHRDRHEVGWFHGKWPAEIMCRLFHTLEILQAPFCMEADPSVYASNMMQLEEWGIV